MAMAVLTSLQVLEMAWPFRNGQLFLLADLIPHKFDISGQVCSVAFKCNISNTIKLMYLLELHLTYCETYIKQNIQQHLLARTKTFCKKHSY